MSAPDVQALRLSHDHSPSQAKNRVGVGVAPLRLPRL